MVRRRALFFRLALSSALSATFAASYGTEYRIEALDPSIGNAYCVNDLGQTAGNLRGTAPMTWDAYLDFGSGPVDIGKVPGDGYGIATQINGRGMASGMGRQVDPNDPYNASKWVSHAFAYGNGTLIPLGALPGGSQSWAGGINDAGQVAGWSESAAGRRALVWKGGTMTTLDPLPGDDSSQGFGIDEDGDVVGMSGIAGRHSRPVVFRGGTATELSRLAGGTDVYALHTSRGGEIVGTDGGLFGGQFGYRSWILRGGQAIDLGTLYDSAYAFANSVNDAGVAVGYVEHLGQRAFVYDGTMRDLNDLIAPGSAGWTLDHANWVNDAGQIVGSGTLNGMGRAFLATPVPEPATWLVLGGSILLAGRRRRIRS